MAEPTTGDVEHRLGNNEVAAHVVAFVEGVLLNVGERFRQGQARELPATIESPFADVIDGIRDDQRSCEPTVPKGASTNVSDGVGNDQRPGVAHTRAAFPKCPFADTDDGIFREIDAHCFGDGDTARIRAETCFDHHLGWVGGSDGIGQGLTRRADRAEIVGRSRNARHQQGKQSVKS